MVKNKNAGKPRNYALEGGVYRFGRSKMYHKKAAYKFLKKKTAKKVSCQYKHNIFIMMNLPIGIAVRITNEDNLKSDTNYALLFTFSKKQVSSDIITFSGCSRKAHLCRKANRRRQKWRH